MNYRHIDHRLTHTRVLLLGLAQTTIPHKPTKRPLDHLWEVFLGPVQHRLTAVLIRNVGRLDHARNQHPQDIHQEVPLTAADFLAAIVAALGRLDRRAVADGGRRRGFLAGLATDGGVQGGVDTQLQAVRTPAAEGAGHGAPGWEIVGPLPPRAAGAFQVEDGVENTAVVQAAASAAFVGFG
jgi:hypothetical protein